MESEVKHICCNIDDNYTQHCGVMLISLFENCNNPDFVVHILASNLCEENKEKLNKITTAYNSKCQFYQVNNDSLKRIKHRKVNPLNEATCYRLLLASTLDKSISKVLYLDVDILVLNDLCPIFSVDIENYALAAAKDLITMDDNTRFRLSMPYTSPYINAGVMLLNLDYWRKNNYECKLIDYITDENMVLDQYDQDVLNAVFHDHIFLLSPKWNKIYPWHYKKSFFENKCDFKESISSPNIVHFVNIFKPWNRIYWFGIRWNRYRRIYRKYLRMTPWGRFSFKYQKLRLPEYRKFGMYRFLFKFSALTAIRDTSMVLYRFFNRLEKMFCLPFLVVLKIYYKIR